VVQLGTRGWTAGEPKEKEEELPVEEQQRREQQRLRRGRMHGRMARVNDFLERRMQVCVNLTQVLCFTLLCVFYLTPVCVNLTQPFEEREETHGEKTFRLSRVALTVARCVSNCFELF
jgi:hypothetical protein